MKTFTLFWRDGKREVVSGTDINNAITKAGYGQGAVKALDFWSQGDNRQYVWIKKPNDQSSWTRREVALPN